MDADDYNDTQAEVAPGLRNDAENVLDFPAETGRPGGKPGNKNALKHGAYQKEGVTAEEEPERARFESELVNDLGGNPSTAQLALIHRASFLEIRLRRCERADSNGLRIADEHVLSWINAQRLLLCALGLERKTKPAENLQDYLKKKDAAGGQQ